MLKVSPIQAFSDNYIWLLQSDGGATAVVVDPGDATPVIERLERDNLELGAILITHHHRDHTGGVARLVERYGCTVFGPANSRFSGIDRPLKDGDDVDLESLGARFKVIATPGHTLDHICYYGERTLFCGDTLFASGCGAIFEGDAPQMYNSLQRIAALDPETQVYCAHEYTLDNLAFARIAEPENDATAARQREAEQQRQNGKPTVPTSLATELQTNPFLRSEDVKLIEAAEEFAGQPLQTPAEVFATVRHWKDTLD